MIKEVLRGENYFDMKSTKFRALNYHAHSSYSNSSSSASAALLFIVLSKKF